MRVLVFGSGAREHALAWRLSQDSSVEIITAPGNPGTDVLGKRVAANLNDVSQMVEVAKRHSVDFVVVGPEAPLIQGVVDRLNEHGIAAFGPTQVAAQLEGSKAYSKEFMRRHDIPTADFRIFTDADQAEQYIREANRPLVVKADGIAAGKGVVVASDTSEALQAVQSIMREKRFGSAGNKVVIEECLVGEEVSYHVVSDGERYVALAPAQDHKRVHDGDKGPNTGGMGAYSPPAVVTPAIEKTIRSRIVEPTLRGMSSEGHPFRGALFVGLMMVRGEPYVLEYNVRFGDPECETLVTRWKGPFLPLLMGAAKSNLEHFEAQWEYAASMCVILASGGYPEKYETGHVIEGVDAANALTGVRVFHAGTKRRDDCALITDGGRVLAVTAVGADMDSASQLAYSAVSQIRFDGCHYRNDIGWRARSKS